MPAPAPHVLAIELGTSSIKVALVGVDGTMPARAVRPVETRRIPPKGAEQDPDALWRAVRSAVHAVLREAALPRATIAAVACDSQYSSVIGVDAAARATTPLLLWMDERGGSLAMDIYARHPDALTLWAERHGIPPLPSGTDALSKMLWVQHERPEAWARTRSFLEPMDWLVAQLTGRLVATAGTAFMLLLTDNREPDALAFDPDLVAMAGVDPEKLPTLLPLGAWAGAVRPETAADLGLAPGTKVLTAINDTQAASIATATFRPGRGAANVGTTGQLLAHVAAKQLDLEHSLVSMPGPLPGRYVVMAENGVAAKALDHCLRRILFAADALAVHAPDDPFRGLDTAVSATPPGADDLLFLPWLTGLITPESNPNARGAFVNVSLTTDRARMVRAVLEGVAMSQRWLLPAVEAFAGTTFDTLRFSGGGARSDAWAQIFADVLQRPIHPLADPVHSNNRAAALLAFEALGLAALEQIDAFCPVRGTFEPRPDTAPVYDRLFAQFRAALGGLRPVFDALNGGG